MQWKEVDYQLHQMKATVKFTTPHEPHVNKFYAGRIRCPGKGVVPILQSDNKNIHVPWYAEVFVDTQDLYNKFRHF